MDHISSSVMDV